MTLGLLVLAKTWPEITIEASIRSAEIFMGKSFSEKILNDSDPEYANDCFRKRIDS
jgi:hypothetical protein